MANHVSWRFQIHQASKEVMEKFSKMQEICEERCEEQNVGLRFVDMFADPKKVIEEVDLPKWNTVDDFDSDTIVGTSAWGAPIEGCAELLRELGDKDIISSITYDDEGLNFIGCTVFKGSHEFEEEYLEHDEIMDLVRERLEANLKEGEELSEDDLDDMKWEEAYIILDEVSDAAIERLT